MVAKSATFGPMTVYAHKYTAVGIKALNSTNISIVPLAILRS